MEHYSVMDSLLHFNIVKEDDHQVEGWKLSAIGDAGLKAIIFINRQGWPAWHAYGFYTTWEAEVGSLDTDTHLEHDEGIGQIVSDPSASELRAYKLTPGEDAPGLVLWGPTYKQQARDCNLEYDHCARFWLKSDGDGPQGEPLATLLVSATVYDTAMSDYVEDFVIVDSTIYSSQLSHTYTPIELYYQLNELCLVEGCEQGVEDVRRLYAKDVEFKVIWYGNHTLYIDRVEVYDTERGRELFYDSSAVETIRENVRNYADPALMDSVLYAWYLKDEPNVIDLFAPYRKVDEILREEGMMGITTYYRDPIEFAKRANPAIFNFNRYPLIHTTGYSGEYGIWSRAIEHGLQTALDYLTEGLKAAKEAAVDYGKEFWVTLQAFSCPAPPDNSWGWRLPTPMELGCMTNLALTYGAKGILYWKYYYTEGGCSGLYAQYADTATANWRYIRDVIGPEIEVLGPVFAELDWETAFPYDDISVNNCDIISVIAYDSLHQNPDSGYIEVGTFSDLEEASYFMLVNRVCNIDSVTPANPQVVTVKIARTGIWTIKDMYSGDETQLTSSGFVMTFTTTLGSGQGKLLRLREVFLGDVNGDGVIDVLDVMLTVNIILGIHDPTLQELCAADFNSDGEVNVLDVVLIVNEILGDGAMSAKRKNRSF
ncbi:MAG: dockerin type I repeat-containing protein [bacterium]